MVHHRSRTLADTNQHLYKDKEFENDPAQDLQPFDLTPGGIKTIPVKHYRVLKVQNIQKGVDKKKAFFRQQLYFKGETPPAK